MTDGRRLRISKEGGTCAEVPPSPMGACQRLMYLQPATLTSSLNTNHFIALRVSGP